MAQTNCKICGVGLSHRWKYHHYQQEHDLSRDDAIEVHNREVEVPNEPVPPRPPPESVTQIVEGVKNPVGTSKTGFMQEQRKPQTIPLTSVQPNQRVKGSKDWWTFRGKP